MLNFGAIRTRAPDMDHRRRLRHTPIMHPSPDDLRLRLLRRFVAGTPFATHGALITDLDGTLLHDCGTHYGLPEAVAQGLKAIRAAGLPVVVNTLRPPAALRHFGQEWQRRVCAAPLPAVLLNGSLLGRMHPGSDGAPRFEALEAFPLEAEDVARALHRADMLRCTAPGRLAVAYYPRDWRQGEIVWTPAPASAAAVAGLSGESRTWAGTLAELKAALLAQDTCMVRVADGATAHAIARGECYTRQGIDKLHGARRMAQWLGLRLEDALGAGNGSMDGFLRGVGLAVHVGRPLEFEGKTGTVVVAGGAEFGALLAGVAGMVGTAAMRGAATLPKRPTNNPTTA